MSKTENKEKSDFYERLWSSDMSGVDINDQMKAGRKVIIIYNRLLESEIKKDTKIVLAHFRYRVN
jgi:hypothetical protein